MKLTKTPVANLYRADSGCYILKAKIKGRIVQKSLETKSFRIAQAKIAKAHREQAERIENLEKFKGGERSFAAMEAAWTEADTASANKDRTKDYHKECLKAINLAWPELAAMEADTISDRDCLEFALKLRNKYSPARYNGMIDILRRIFQVSIARGIRVSNPAGLIEKASVKQKELHLPTQAEFAAMLDITDASKIRSEAAIVIRFLAYTGMRVNEAAQVTLEMIDWQRMEFRLPGSITKNGQERRVPIIAELKPILERLGQGMKSNPGQVKLLPIRDPRRCLRTLCTLVKIRKITNHDLRHLFVTRCIESGVDVKTVASWVGHQDGGALILKTYAHLRNEHSQAMAAKVRFS